MNRADIEAVEQEAAAILAAWGWKPVEEEQEYIPEGYEGYGAGFSMEAEHF